MKLKKSAFLFLLAASSTIASAFATTVTYDADTVTSGAQDGVGAGWNTTNFNFWDGSGNVLWPNTNADEAVFGAASGAAGSVTVGTVTANKITFNAPGSGNYTLTGGNITLAGTTPIIATNTAATIASGLAGTVGYTKNGAGLLTFTGTKSITGPVTIAEGAVSLTAGTGGTAITVASGASATTTASNVIGWNNACRIWNIAGALTISGGDSAWNTTANLSGASMTGTGNWSFGGDSGIGSVVNILASANPTTFSGGTLTIREGNANNQLVVNVEDGTASPDLALNIPVIAYNSLAVTGAGSTAISGIISNSGNVRMNGTGILTLSGVNTFTGQTTVNSGTLALTGSAALPSSIITIASGAKFDFSALSAGAFTVASGKTLTAGRSASPAIDLAGHLALGGGALNVAGDGSVGTMTVDGNLALNGGLLQIDQAGGVSDKISLSGASRTLSLSGINTITSYLPVGSYTLIDGYTTAPVGGAANFAYIGGARNSAGTFTVGASSVTLDVTAGLPGAIIWSGAAANTVWDVNTTANWNTNAEKFYQLDTVTFGDSPANSTVTINGTVLPGSISFTNATTAYTVRGGTNPVIGGTGALTKSGGATVTLWHPANTYSGGTSISDGTLFLKNDVRPANGSYSPLGTGLVTLNGGGTLQLDPGAGGGNTFTFPNALRLNGGTLFHEDGNSVFNGVATVDVASFIKTQWGAKNLTLAGGLAGSANLTVSDQGAGQGGTVILGADGSYSGTLTINNILGGGNGAVQLNSANALQNAVVAVNTTAAIDEGYPRGLILGGAADTNFTVASLSGTQAAAVHSVSDSNFRTLTVNQSGDSTFSGSIGGTSPNTLLNLVKSGSGSLTLAGADTYIGNTTVTGGTLVMRTRAIGTGVVTVADGATLGLSSTGVKLSISGLNLGTSGSNTLAITGYTADVATPVIDAQTLNKNATTTTISISGTLVSGSTFPQTYPLIKYGSSTGSGGFALAPLPRGVAGTLVDSGTSIDLKISGYDNLVWKGTAGNTWDLNTTGNWKLGATNPATYQNGDNVVFDGSAANNTVDLTATVAPTSLNFNFDSPTAYTLTGIGAITGPTGLIKSGTGTLTLGTANSYNGITSVNAGTLVLGNGNALGSAVGVTTVADGAVLDLNGYSIDLEPCVLAGSLINTGAADSTLGSAISLTDDAIIGGSGNVILTVPVTGAYSLEKTGTGTLTLTGNNAYTGSTTINGGTLVFGTVTGTFFTYAGGQININNDATMQVKQIGGTNRYDFKTQTFNFGASGGGKISIVGANTNWVAQGNWTFITNGGAKNTIDGEAKINMNNGGRSVVLDVTRGTDPASDLDIAIEIGNTNGNLTKTGTGIATLAAANSYTGNTIVASGTLNVAATGRLRFLLGSTSGTTNTLSGAGTATLDGGFSIDTSAADALTSGTWLLETMGATSTYGIGFKVYQADGTTPWANAGGNKWTKPAAGGNAWTFDEATGTLTLAPAAVGFDSWAALQILNVADRDRSADPDGDGFTNLQEFLFGRNPIASDGSLMSSSVAGGFLTLRWLQRETGATCILKESATLADGSWTISAVIPQSDTQTGVPENYDQWRADIPVGADKKFFRIEGVETP